MAPQSIPTQACGRSLNSVIPLEFAKLPLLGRSLSLGCVARPPFSTCSEQLLVVLRLPHCLAQPLQFSHPPQAPLLRQPLQTNILDSGPQLCLSLGSAQSFLPDLRDHSYGSKVPGGLPDVEGCTLVCWAWCSEPGMPLTCWCSINVYSLHEW